MRKILFAFAAVAAITASGSALASGFSIYEQSAKASGQAGAWVARADDAAANWYNPAALAKMEGAQFQFGTNYINIGSNTTFTIDQSGAAAATNIGFPTAAGTRYDAESNTEFPSHLYYAQKLNEKWAFGVGATVPYGLVTEWKDLPITLVSEKAKLMSLNVNPNLAFKVNDAWSFAFGLDYLYTDISEFSRVVPLDLDTVPGAETLGRSNLTGNGDAFGWNVAAHCQGADWSFGFTYRSAQSPDIDGTLKLTGAGMTLLESKGTTTLNLPSQAAIGIAYTALPKFDLEMDLSYAQWSRFRELAIDLQSAPDIVQAENWSDTLAFRVGAAWDVAEGQELRFGIVRDSNPIPSNTLRPSIPDADRTGICLGYGYAGDKLHIDGYAMHLKFDRRDAAGVLLSGSPNDGVIDGAYRSKVLLLGVTAAWNF